MLKRCQVRDIHVAERDAGESRERADMTELLIVHMAVGADQAPKPSQPSHANQVS